MGSLLLGPMLLGSIVFGPLPWIPSLLIVTPLAGLLTLMSILAFIFGVLPLALATGAGAEMRQALGTAVFFGMLGVTLFGLIFTPVFYVITRRLARD
jgi:hypothetical protein